VRVICDDWVLDTATRQLARGAATVHLSPKAFDLLTTLLLARPRALSKAELLVRLWPEALVSEATLVSLIAELRSALGDPARQPRYVRTVHRYGYAFCGVASEEVPSRSPGSGLPASARLLLDGRELALPSGAHLLGRVPEASVWIDSASVSRHHARITVSDAGSSIEDLGSKNGTFLNGTRVTGIQPLRDQDEVRLGRVRVVFRAFTASASTETGGS
jgi:DNA-binding winged helix-turn-helix (wHTH) protein